jgi:hypothetical protein
MEVKSMYGLNHGYALKLIPMSLVQWCKAGNTRVTDLIHQGTKSWNWRLINGLFKGRDREEISKLAIVGMEGEEDKRIWRYNNKGFYIVKLAHRFVMDT